MGADRLSQKRLPPFWSNLDSKCVLRLSILERTQNEGAADDRAARRYTPRSSVFLFDDDAGRRHELAHAITLSGGRIVASEPVGLRE